MRRPGVAVLFVAAALHAAPAAAQLTLTDGTFVGWSNPELFITGSGSSISATTQSTGGNTGGSPDPRRNFTHQLRGLLYGFHGSTFSWNPATQGSIDGLGMWFDYIALSAASPSSAIAFMAGIKQGAHFYAYLPSYRAPMVGTGWHTMAEPSFSLAATDWCRFAGVSSNYSCTQVAPELTTSGGTLQFGVITANSGSTQTLSGAFDDFGVSLQYTSTVPEPVSMALLGTGLAGLAGVRRRRRRDTVDV